MPPRGTTAANPRIHRENNRGVRDAQFWIVELYRLISAAPEKNPVRCAQCSTGPRSGLLDVLLVTREIKWPLRIFVKWQNGNRG